MAAWPAGAQAPLSLTLDDALRRGVETSHRLAAATAGSESAEAAVAVRHAASRPLITAQAGALRTSHIVPFVLELPGNQSQLIYPDITDNYRTRVDLEWPLYTGGRLGALERASRLDADAVQHDVAAAESDLRLEITRAYWAYVTAIESLRVVQESERRIQAHVQDLRLRLAAGVVPRSDVFSAEAQQSRQRMLRIRARTVRDVAAATLSRLVGLDPGTAVDPVSTLEPPSALDAALIDLLEQARKQRPERAALERRVNGASEQQRAAAAGARPTIAAEGGLEYGRPNQLFFPREEAWKVSWRAAVNVSWVVFDGGSTRAQTAGAAATVRAAEQRLADFDSALAVEIRQGLSELESGRAEIDAADDSVHSAAEARRVVEDRFRAGVATSTDVRDAQVALLQAELDRTHAIATARLAEAALFRALGR